MDKALELCDDLEVAPAGEVRIDPTLDGRCVQLDQSDPVTEEQDRVNVDECTPAPDCKCLPEPKRGRLGLVVRFLEKRLEDLEVEFPAATVRT